MVEESADGKEPHTVNVPLWAWVAFASVILVMLAIDLLAHRRDHVIEFKEAAWWSAVWVGVSIIFAGIIFATYGAGPGVDFTTAWLLEKSLSVDNLFVFALIFGYFQVPREYQHRVLFLGVLGALVFRGIFLGLGVAVVSTFTAVLFVFGAILLYSAWKLLKDDDDVIDPSKSLAVRLLKKVLPVTDGYRGHKLITRENGVRMATPLLAVLVAIEAADLVFAVDSVPAVLAVSDEPFIVYTSNAFAILGLRALYFLLSGLLNKFHFLSKGLALILGFIGVKLFLQAAHKTIDTSIPEIPSWVSLIVIVVVLTASVVLSLRFPAAKEESPEQAGEALAARRGVQDEAPGDRLPPVGEDEDSAPSSTGDSPAAARGR